MIDEDKTYENEVRYNNDRLGNRNSRKDSKVNISLELESTNSQKIQKKENSA